MAYEYFCIYLFLQCPACSKLFFKTLSRQNLYLRIKKKSMNDEPACHGGTHATNRLMCHTLCFVLIMSSLIVQVMGSQPGPKGQTVDSRNHTFAGYNPWARLFYRSFITFILRSLFIKGIKQTHARRKKTGSNLGI